MLKLNSSQGHVIKAIRDLFIATRLENIKKGNSYLQTRGEGGEDTFMSGHKRQYIKLGRWAASSPERS